MSEELQKKSMLKKISRGYDRAKKVLTEKIDDLHKIKSPFNLRNPYSDEIRFNQKILNQLDHLKKKTRMMENHLQL